MLYSSPYNVVIPYGEEVLLFNTRSLQFGRLTASIYAEALESIAILNSGPPRYPIDEKIKHVLFELRYRGFLVDDPAQERNTVVSRFDRQRSNRGHLGLTIAPTDGCNFACPYCYENLNYTYMSAETQQHVAEFIANSLNSGKYQSMHVTWYGGEPLMPKSLHAIEFLSERIGDACFKGNIRYSANIISNGYLLNRTVAERLAKCGITLAQITLDGPREQHNRTRVLKNGSGTFDRILENIGSCNDLLRFSIRMNVTTENAWSVAELKSLLREKGILDDPKRTTFYISPVRSYTSACKSVNCMSNESFYRMQADMLWAGINDDGFETVEEYPASKDSVCTAVNPGSFVIGPDGSLYKCWLDIGRHELAVGSIGENRSGPNTNVNKWIDYSPFKGTSCTHCSMLPVCMGGCPELNMRSAGQDENQACCNWKYCLDDHLLYVASRENTMNAAKAD
jgi:uncharacterized protein